MKTGTAQAAAGLMDHARGSELLPASAAFSWNLLPSPGRAVRRGRGCTRSAGGKRGWGGLKEHEAIRNEVSFMPLLRKQLLSTKT